MLADRPRAQAPARPEEEHLQHDHADQHAERDRANPDQRADQRADDRDVGQERWQAQGLELSRRRRRMLADEQVQVAGNPDGEDVDDGAADDLVSSHRDRQPGVDGRNRHGRQDGQRQADQQRQRDAHDPDPQVGQELCGDGGGPPGDEGGGQHHALDPDVHHPRALVHEPAQRTQDDGHGGSHDGRGQHRQLDDDVHDELDDHADDGDVVQELHQRPTSSPARRSCGSPSAARSRGRSRRCAP